MEDLIVRGVYSITSRNLLVGAYLRDEEWNGQTWHVFIGIREKFGYRYLTTEYGWNPTFLGMIPKHAQLTENDKALRRSLAAYEWHHKLGR